MADEEHGAGATLEGVADALYALPLEEFTAARDARAKTLRAAGEKELARVVAALRRPTTAAWAVNQLVRARRDEVEQLLELGAALRDAQEAFAGEELRELNRQQHRVIAAIRQEARAVAAQAGQRLTETVGRQVEATLRAGMADAAAAEAVRSGLLTSDLESTGFEPVDLEGAVAVPPVAGIPGGRAPARSARRSDDAVPTTSTRPGRQRGAAAERVDRDADRSAEQRRRRRAQEEAERLEEERRRAERERELAEARARADQTARARDDAQDRLAAAERAVEELDRLREELAARLAELRAALDAAQADDDAAARDLGHAADERDRAARVAEEARRDADEARTVLERLERRG
ncbi:hypothetical protein [Actinotalea sp. Marseille-Q4924]|uniref:hypothetical protein n=1 Tax=Actinotalea sp. Marseille-Q4924 TaxID=2866571 RepID=UPI001CE42FE5|nr:hypothetical protein [Actinotalea sp. Marseille-Q4924]